MDKRYIDPETGGFVEASVIARQYYEQLALKQRFEWFKTYPKFLKPLGLDSRETSPRVTVLIWILNNLNPSDNTFPGKTSYIVEESHVGTSTVLRTIKLLIANDYIRQTRDDRWMINPFVVHAGDDSRRQWLAEKYSNLPLPKKRTRRPAENIDEQERRADNDSI